MLQILNPTPLKAALTLALDPQGREKLCVAVKGTFVFPAAGEQPGLADEQVAPLATDVHFGEPGKSSLKYPADLVLGKRGTDVLLIGTAVSPGRRPVTRLESSVRVGPLTKDLVVHGDRRWTTGFLGLFLGRSRPRSFVTMPLRYERAFGGSDLSPRNERRRGWDARNPIGTGFRVSRRAVPNTALPNLEERGSAVGSWKKRPAVAGFGPIDGAWEPRRRFAGTYDASWQASQAPLLPTDFDLRFFNCAPPGLTSDRFLKGGEPVELVHVSEEERIAFALPQIEIGLTLHRGEQAERRSAELWTVMFIPDERRFFMVWGLSFDAGKQPSQAHGVEVTASGPMASQWGTGHVS